MDNFFSSLNFGLVKCYGITQDPKTLNYALVLEYMKNGNLRSYLNQNANSINWKQRLNHIYSICFGLNGIHEAKLIHKDLHGGNILNNGIEHKISDFGFCMQANEVKSN